MSGQERALCLMEQRKRMVETLAKRPPVASIINVQLQKPVRVNCTRYSDPVVRAQCLGGNPPGSSSASSASSGQ